MNLLLASEILEDISAEPLTLSAAKAAMKVNFTDDDTFITSLIKNARLWLENYTGKVLGQKVLKYTVEMTGGEWYLLPGPVSFVVSVAKECGNCYEFKRAGDHVQVYNDGVYEITFQTGYEVLPEDLMNDLKRLTAWFYQNRGIDLSNESASLTDFPLLASELYKRVVI